MYIIIIMMYYHYFSRALWSPCQQMACSLPPKKLHKDFNPWAIHVRLKMDKSVWQCSALWTLMKSPPGIVSVKYLKYGVCSMPPRVEVDFANYLMLNDHLHDAIGWLHVSLPGWQLLYNRRDPTSGLQVTQLNQIQPPS